MTIVLKVEFCWIFNGNQDENRVHNTIPDLPKKHFLCVSDRNVFSSNWNTFQELPQKPKIENRTKIKPEKKQISVNVFALDLNYLKIDGIILCDLRIKKPFYSCKLTIKSYQNPNIVCLPLCRYACYSL